MAPRVSIRISLRWLPDEPSEPTDTVVFGVGEYYLDLRILKSNNTIDWALAGERVVISTDPMKVRFDKTLDSLGLTEPDEGSFVKLPNGDDFETGKMACPERGMEITEYEEVWRQIPPVPGPKRAWILESAGEGRKLFLGRIGGGYMAIGDKNGDSFGARKEEWDEGTSKWVVKYSIGVVDDIPSVADLGTEGFAGEDAWKAGETVSVSGRAYKVRGFETFK